MPRDPAAAGAPRRAQGPCSLRRASRHRSRSASVPHPSPLSCCLQSPRPAGPARCSALAALRAGFLFFLFSPPLPNLSDPDTSWPKATAMLQGHMGISPTTGSLTTPLHLQSPPPPPASLGSSRLIVLWHLSPLCQEPAPPPPWRPSLNTASVKPSPADPTDFVWRSLVRPQHRDLPVLHDPRHRAFMSLQGSASPTRLLAS